MTEPTLEFIGRRLQAIQEEQHLFRARLGTIELRLDALETHLARIEVLLDMLADRFVARLDQLDERFDRLETLIKGA
jgi:hypothetical protein